MSGYLVSVGRHLTTLLWSTNYTRFLPFLWKLCTRDGILKGTYGQEQLTPAPQHTAKGLGIFYIKLDKKKTITMTQAGEKFCPVGGKFSFCQCQKDCSTSKTCKCRKANKFCTQHCHKGKGFNLLCKNWLPENERDMWCKGVGEHSIFDAALSIFGETNNGFYITCLVCNVDMILYVGEHLLCLQQQIYTCYEWKE